MKIALMISVSMVLTAGTVRHGPAVAQIASGSPSTPAATSTRRSAEAQEIEKLNAWTVGLAAGQLEGAPIRLGTDMARVVDDGDELHVLPIVTRGPTENVEALLYLKGIDVAIMNSDTLQQFRSLVPDIQQRIKYILNLFPSELHVFVRPDIKSLSDLEGRKVNFNTPGTTASYSGPLIFDQLKLHVQKTFIPHQVALEQMRTGKTDIAAVVFITAKPIDAFAHDKWDPGFKFLPVSLPNSETYLPSKLTSSDYPQLIPNGEAVDTVAIPTILASYNWSKGSDRYKRVARFTDYLFNRLATLQGPGFHPQWENIDLAASVPGLTRFAAAQEWLDRRPRATAPSSIVVRSDSATQPGEQAIPTALQRQQLYQQFLQWQHEHPK